MTEIRRLDAERFRPYSDASVEVFATAMNVPAGQLQPRHEMLRRHLQRPGFAAVVALEDAELVGFGYAYPGQAGQWWHDFVAATLGPEASTRWMTGSFEVAELHVRPEAQGAGLGRRLLTLLLTDAPGRTAVLSTGDRDSPARRLYHSMGFVDLLTGLRFPGGNEDFAVLGRPLPLPAG